MKEQLKSIIDQLKGDVKIEKAMQILEETHEAIVDLQMQLCAIRSPSNMEENRAKHFYELMSQIGLDHVYMDEVNNVIGLWKGTGDGPTLVVAAHMDTVFGPEIDCTPVKKEDGFIWGPGICDDTRGMVEVYAIAKTMCETGIRAKGDILFVGNVGEESLGDLRGSKHLFANNPNIDVFMSIDGPQIESLVTNAIAGCKYRFTYTGRGGHALGAFGIPNVNNALGYAMAKIATLEVPKDPLSIFNIGVVQGGVSVNAIPAKSSMMIDLRSMSQTELDRMKAFVVSAAKEGLETELARWNHPTETLELQIEILSERPGGTQPIDAPVVQAALAAYEAYGIEPKLQKGASTDSNIPISRGIPAVTVSRGGIQIDGHTVNERFQPDNAFVGTQRDLILALLLAGYDNIAEPVIK
ncbi:MAG: M20/M25/M40 family metallo-hydrolase [Lachnospiraceae bacterium]|nr:M20/M25/M40 family metallo-hydrolase [Lachnospiraceae bacterium]